MEHYVTLFDSLFLPQGLALHSSMERHAGRYTLWILCMDDEAYRVLSVLKLPNVKLLALNELETDELKRVKFTRTKGEYCWTMTPFAIHFVFEADVLLERVTYLDADMWFRKSPVAIFNEFKASGKCVMITDHAYAPEYDQSATSGQFCVQFMVFERNGGEVVRKWWEERCLEWCYARFENGKFGDQKYLDDWPVLFSKLVHVMQDSELMLAPWNATRFPYGRAICWHFHSLRILTTQSNTNYWIDYGDYPLPTVTKKYIYAEYLKDLHKSLVTLMSVGCVIKTQKKRDLIREVKKLLKGNWRRLDKYRLKLTPR